MKKLLIAAFGLVVASTCYTPYAYSQTDDSDSDVTSVCLNNPASLSSVNGFCVLTPEKYEVKIYEIGLCTSNPLSASRFTKDSCIVTLTNTSPISADMANGNSLTLESKSKIDPPKPGNYGFAYIVIEEDFKLKFTYKLNDIIYYSDGTNSSGSIPANNAKTTPPALDFTQALNTFGEPGAFEGTASAPVVGGTINALLTDSNLGAATSAASVSRLVGVFSATKAVTITDETKGLEVQFIVTNQGGGVESCARDEGPDNNDAQEEEERLRAEEDREIAESGGAEEVIIRVENARSLRDEKRDKQDRERLEGININLAKVCTFGSGPFSVSFKPF